MYGSSVVQKAGAVCGRVVAARFGFPPGDLTASGLSGDVRSNWRFVSGSYYGSLVSIVTDPLMLVTYATLHQARSGRRCTAAVWGTHITAMTSVTYRINSIPAGFGRMEALCTMVQSVCKNI